MTEWEEYPNPPATLEQVITHIEATDEASWCTDVVRTAEDGRNCFFGHLFNMGADDQEGAAIWDWFECRWMTTYGMYPINDGRNPRYPQPTPKQRCVAALHALRDGTELTTMESMDQEYEHHLAMENA
ncbi:hypothetical protein [Curtobacterium sp. MCSS17_016]|uniref:hypothetical protein n=1 Tax=Curtobacterium sp. MCSS17_016 TaxID=2175644 RepID=UPI000DA963EF|nr:hypothetical protein [Curtobacterium sp. MCSS17_016]WIE80938.1 hypothetical protein DEJ19_020695 [Curtobacterium sp. MCSS17_016]